MSVARMVASFALLVTVAVPVAAQSADPPVSAMKVTVLSTMLVGNAREGVGEWGFAAVLEVDGRRWLVDTGARPDTVLKNAQELKVDLSTITEDFGVAFNNGSSYVKACVDNVRFEQL